MFSDDSLDAHEMNELQRAIALSLQDIGTTASPEVHPKSSVLPYGGAASSAYQAGNDHTSKRRRDAADSESTRTKKLKTRELRNAEIREKILNVMKEATSTSASPMKYKGGALRLTRTPGRSRVNTVTLGDLIDPLELRAAFVFAYCIGNECVFQHLPLKTSPNFRPHCPVYIGRDLSLDTEGKEFAHSGPRLPDARKEFDRVVRCAREGYQQKYGENFHAVYPYMTGGCAHSKLMVLIYPGFLRLVITSANLIDIDVELGDNSWFIQDFPSLPEPNPAYKQTEFEKHLVGHLADLQCPKDFLDRYFAVGLHDFSSAKVYLVTSKRGSFSGRQAELYGQLRLSRIISRKILRKFKTDAEIPKMTFEVCVGSIGHLETAGMLKTLLDSCAGNRQESIEGKPAIKLVFPTLADVKKTRFGVAGASIISSHITWYGLPADSFLRDNEIWHHYISNDRGCGFHLKSILALHDGEPEKTPLFYCTGSHNFSANAWGAVMTEKRAKEQSDGHLFRLKNVQNLECSVVVKGDDISKMLETDNWEDIVPYQRPSAANQYKLGEIPFKFSKKYLEPGFDGGYESENADASTDKMIQPYQFLSPRTTADL
ncbi:tyrosyl-DNA phosphodiesterase-domain-containing protein [Mycena rebaudengoi]|nr:tyrosyl-DNA phosphodiesterase-domain-containing protein [Mycena rebaudengoi]